MAAVASVAKVSKEVSMSKSLAASKDFEQPALEIELRVRCSQVLEEYKSVFGGVVNGH